MKPQIFVSGHRNPDVDSLASAAALAELRRRQGAENIQPLCPGILPDRAKHLFEKFQITPPVCRNDVYPRVRDIMENAEIIPAGKTLFEAVRQLRSSGLPRLPVADAGGKFLGMLSPLNLLSSLLDLDGDGSGLAGRRIYSSIRLMRQLLEADEPVSIDPDAEQEFEVYVAAMSLESFEEHLPRGNNRELAVIAGDRPEIHLRALHRKIRLLIVTGRRNVDSFICKEAAEQGVAILHTRFDSATAIRRLKFSVPVEHCQFPEITLNLAPDDRLRDVRNRVVNQPEDVIPVVEEDGSLRGVVLKQSFSAPPPARMILLDHNEIDQSIPGAEELPVIEVVDHHRIGMMPTATPIKFTGDTVGSTCTLVASMFRSSGESLTPGLAGLLLGGIISDTLLLKSPTTAALDCRMCEWLEKLSGVKGSDLMAELMRIDSPLAVKPARDVVNGDRKDYTDGSFHFALAQVEETNLELLHQRREELAGEIREILGSEKLDFFGLLVTDAVRENSELLMLGAPEIIRSLPYEQIGPDLFALPGVLSRKKQLLPQILAITAALQKN